MWRALASSHGQVRAFQARVPWQMSGDGDKGGDKKPVVVVDQVYRSMQVQVRIG